MRRLFIASHGKLASGIASSIEILCGSSEKATFFDAYLDEKTIKQQLENFFETVKEDDQVFLLSDLYGGSVNAEMFLELKRKNTTLIAGYNLALILELIATGNQFLSEADIEELVENSRLAMKVVKEENLKAETEDFF